MTDNQAELIENAQAKDVSIRTQTIIWPTSTFVTTWTLGGSSNPTESPDNVVPTPDSSLNSDRNVGPILSGIVALLVLILIVWFCCRRSPSRGYNLRRSSRQQGSSSASKGASNGSTTSNDTSRNGASVGSAASEMVEGQWSQQEPAEGHIPGIPSPAAGSWPTQVPRSHPGIGQAPAPSSSMNFPHGRGGPPPMMSRGMHSGVIQ